MIIDYTKNKSELNALLTQLTEELDISPSQQEDAISKYKAISDYLGRDLKINSFEPEMYPQGSFSLGTVIKPKNDKDQFDIDLVCELKKADCNSITQSNLKNLIGNRLKSGLYKDKLKDLNGGRRCWTIVYAEETQLHLDILPAIPDNKSRTMYSNVFKSYYETAINITDKENDFYEIHDDWVKSNPKGYLLWFKDQMEVQLNESRKIFAEVNKVNIDEVPYYKIKTPLQRAIQLLKRHRDTNCSDEENKPISIIITTLAAQAYRNEDNLYDAITGILEKMHEYICYEYKNGKKIAVIKNPVDERENFADKWESCPDKETVFFEWLKSARLYFNSIFDGVEKNDIVWLNESLSEGFGKEMSRRTFSSIAKNILQHRKNGDLLMEKSTGLLGLNFIKEKSKIVKDHTFHGYEIRQ